MVDFNPSCPVCNSEQYQTFLAEEKMFGMGGQFEYLECANCKSLRIKHIPTDLQAFYPPNYYSFNSKAKDSDLFKFLKRIRSILWDLGLPVWKTDYYSWIKTTSVKKHHEIADIGCGDGQLLKQLRYCGYHNLYGFDPYIKEEYHSKQLNILKRNLEEINQTFDLVMFHHSLEHMENPSEVFFQVKRILKPNGKLIVRVPVTDGQVWKEEKINWLQLDAPRHLFIPSVKALELLAAKFGFKVGKIEFDSLANQFWGTELYKMGKSLHNTDIHKVFSKKELKEFDQKAEEFNKLRIGDQVFAFFTIVK